MLARFIAVVALAARLCGAWESAGAYAPLDVIVGDRLAQMSGFANLSAMASPLDYATSGEAILLVSERAMLLEHLAPHLNWLRRGPRFADDARAGSVGLGSSRLPGAGFASTTMYKLRHDAEQFEYLAATGWRSEWLRTIVIPSYREVLKRVEARVVAAKGAYAAARGHGSQTKLLNGYYEFAPLDLLLVGATYNRALVFAGPHTTLGARLPGAALAGATDWAAADARFAAGRGANVVVVDSALSAASLAALRDYCLGATVFYETKPHNAGGHVGAYAVDGFAAPLLLQIAEELRAALPRALGDRQLLNFWAYKYQHAEPGIGVHRDQASVNVNLWITPESANLDASRGGMLIYDDDGVLDMAVGESPAALLSPDGRRRLDAFPKVQVAYKQNRLALFDSSLPHASDVGAWKPGYTNRRISVSFLFGDASHVVVDAEGDSAPVAS